MEISYLKKTKKDVVVKVFGTPGAVTIDLNDLAIDNEFISGTPTVNLIGVSWTGTNDTEITISRNSQVLLTCPSTGSQYLNFSGDNLTPDIINNTHNFSINMVGTQGQVWLRLRKLSGYDVINDNGVDAYNNLTLFDEGSTWDTNTVWS